HPDADISAELGDDILGLFSGEALHERGETLSPTPPQIHLFLENILEEVGQDPIRYREEIRITLLHELGHYLGWDEEAMEQHGIE
ncbi:MAG: hypothetical protein GVY36_09970, partial [Verrucomicrobia bacterium]|nr:hypothetical protein [Verrucomicrobiota bacterium]